MNTSIIVEGFIKFQIWHPISNSHYKLVSETSIPSAVNYQLRTIDDLKLQFYIGSVVGIYVESARNVQVTLTLLTNNENDKSHSFLHVTNDKLCIFDTTTTGVLILGTINPKIVLDYGMLLYC